jgi:hypothetical protein
VAVHRFTDKWLQSLSIVPDAGRAEFVDAACPGLHLRITVKGTRTFSVLVRPGGKPQRRTLGRYLRITLSEARDAALAALRDPDRGILGQGSRSLVQQSLTLQQLIDAYVERHLKLNARSWKNIRAAFLGSPKRPGRLAHLLNHRATAITKRDIVDVIDGIMHESKPQAAVNLLRYIKMLFNWAADRDIVPAIHSRGSGLPPERTSGTASSATRRSQRCGTPRSS